MTYLLIASLFPVNDLVQINPSQQTCCSGSTRDPLLVLLFLFPAGLKSAGYFIVSLIRFLFLRLQGTAPKSSKASNDGFCALQHTVNFPERACKEFL